jgi:hypothetical protein
VAEERKTFKITADQYKLLKNAEARESKSFKEQIKRAREKQIKHLHTKILQSEREIAFKKEELKGGIKEKHPDFLDGKKPKFFIENDIDELELAISDYKQQIVDLKKAAEEDK